jgi:hypothetical protein
MSATTAKTQTQTQDKPSKVEREKTLRIPFRALNRLRVACRYARNHSAL